jgi:hypothetical protein
MFFKLSHKMSTINISRTSQVLIAHGSWWKVTTKNSWSSIFAFYISFNNAVHASYGTVMNDLMVVSNELERMKQAVIV